jgi:hypothetical protein
MAMYTPDGSTSAEIEQSVRAAERVGHHRAREDDGLARDAVRHGTRRFDHRVGTMRDDDAVLAAARAGINDPRAIGVGHVEAVDHHQRLDRRLDARAAEAQHLGQMRGPERETAVDLVVGLVEGATGHDDANHSSGLRCPCLLACSKA